MSLCIKGGRELSETVKELPVLYDKAAKGYKVRETREKQPPEVFYVKSCS